MQGFTRELAEVHAASGQERHELFYALAKRVAGRLDTVIHHQLNRNHDISAWDIIVKCKEHVDLAANPKTYAIMSIAEQAQRHAYVLATNVEPLVRLVYRPNYEVRYHFFATRYKKDEQGKIVSGESFMFSYGGAGEWQYSGPATEMKREILRELQAKAMQGGCEERFRAAQKVMRRHDLPVQLPRTYTVYDEEKALQAINPHVFSYNTEAYRGAEERFFELYWQSLDGKQRHAVRQLLEVPERNDLQTLMSMDRRDVYWALLEVGATPR